MDNARSLAKLLGQLGREEHPQALFEECAEDVSLDACARLIASRGFDARVVRIRPRDIALLPLPTLVELDGGDLAVLVHAKNEVGTVELGGRTLEVSPASGRSLSGRVIDRSFGAADGDTTEQALTLRALLTTLWKKDRAIRRTVFLFLTYAALLSLVGFASPLLIAVGMDAASTGDVPRTLTLIVVGAILLGGHRSYFAWLRQRATRYLEARLSVTARTAILSHIVRVPLIEAERLAGGSGWQALALVDRVVAGGLGFATTVLLALFGVGYLAVVFVEMPAAGAALIVVGGILVLVNTLVGPRLVEQREAVELASERQRAELLDLIRGAPASQVAGAQRNGVRRWLGLVIDEGQLNLRRFWAERRLQLAIGTVEQLALAGLLVWCGSRCLDGLLTRGSAMAAVQGGTFFLSGCTSLAFAMISGAELRLQMARINDILAIEPMPTVHALRRPLLSPGVPAVKLHDVYFRYASDSPWILRQYSLCIEAGQRVVLRWPSGGGKTTLLRIIAGLVRPTHGIVTVGGLDPAHARGLVTYLPQTTYLFAGAVIDNLTVLSGGQSHARLIAAAKTTGLADIVAKWPMGLETMVALGGANLSGGERQLIALTAALASDRPIVLLDEALSHVDRLSQARLTESDLFSGKTVIRVVHEEAMLEKVPAAAKLAKGAVQDTPLLGPAENDAPVQPATEVASTTPFPPRVSETAPDAVVEQILAAPDSQTAADHLFAFMRTCFGAGALFVVKGLAAEGRFGYNEGAECPAVEQVTFSLSLPSCFRDAFSSGDVFHGAPAIDGEPVHRAVWTALESRPPRGIVVAPIVVQNQCAFLLYAQGRNGNRIEPLATDRLRRVCAALATTLVRLAS